MSRAGESHGVHRILEYLRQTLGFDFTAYKPASLTRRIRWRMQAVEVDDYDAYLDHLRVHPEESAALFQAILVGVTSFFRDADLWDGLRTDVLPGLPAIRSGGPVRVWSAGCATGQEACSVAMLIVDLIGRDEFRNRVTIYATDVDEEALAEGRRGLYSAKQVGSVPAALLTRYFEHDRATGVYAFARGLRDAIVFRRHDLINDAPIEAVDLVLCRNTLMYFDGHVQTHVMTRIAKSLHPGGRLILSPADMDYSDAALIAVDLTRRIYTTALTL